MSPIEVLLYEKARLENRGTEVEDQWKIWERNALAMILSQLASMERRKQARG
jgi:hypothetical protein